MPRKLLVGLVLLAGLALFVFILLILPVEEPAPSLPEEGCLVLVYHRVVSPHPVLKFLARSPLRYPGDGELRYYTVFRDEFADQVRHMLEQGANFITPEELEDYIFRRIELPPKSVLLTFDDVDVSVYENAYPFLLDEGIPFTLFIITGHVGSPDFKGLSLSSWDQIGEMVQSGLASVGAHSHDFHYLDKDDNPPFLDPEQGTAFALDAALTVQTIEKQLGFTPYYYSYPYGFGNPETDYILMDAGYRLIFSLAYGTVRPGDPSFFVNRVLVTGETWPVIAEWFER